MCRRSQGCQFFHSNYLCFQETQDVLIAKRYCEFPHAAGEATLLLEGTCGTANICELPRTWEQGEKSEYITYFSVALIEYRDKKQLRGGRVSWVWHIQRDAVLHGWKGLAAGVSHQPGGQERRQKVEARNCSLGSYTQHVGSRDRLRLA